MPAIKFESVGQLSRKAKTLLVYIREDQVEAIDKLISDSISRGDGRIAIELTRPYRPRSTKPRGQNRRFRGHCADIAEQIVDEEGYPVHTKEQIAEALKRMAIEEGYPWRVGIDGMTEAKSTSEVTVEEMQVLIETQVRFADEHQLYLTEYDDMGREYKAVGGEPVKTQ